MLAVVIALIGFFIGGVWTGSAGPARAAPDPCGWRRPGDGGAPWPRAQSATDGDGGPMPLGLRRPLRPGRGDRQSRLDAAISGMRAEARRAGEVVRRRLRTSFRTGATRLEAVPLDELIAAAGGALPGQARQAGVRFCVAEVPALTLLADRLRLEVVLRNPAVQYLRRGRCRDAGPPAGLDPAERLARRAGSICVGTPARGSPPGTSARLRVLPLLQIRRPRPGPRHQPGHRRNPWGRLWGGRRRPRRVSNSFYRSRKPRPHDRFPDGLHRR